MGGINMEIRKAKAQDINDLVNNRMEFEDKIKANVDKKFLKRQGITQAEIAERYGTTHAYINLLPILIF